MAGQRLFTKLTEAQWNKVHSLARLRIEDATEMFFADIERVAINEMGSTVMGRTKDSLSGVIRDIWISRLDSWLRLTIDCYMKAISSLKIEISSDLLAKVLEDGVLPAAGEYKKTCQSKWDAHERFLHVPFPFRAEFDAYAERLINRIRRRFDIRILELTGVSKGQSVVELDEINPQIRINKEWHTLAPQQYGMLKILFAACGQWIGGKEIGGRPDKLIKAMPQSVANLIETNRQHGYRIPCLLKR